MDAKGQTPGVDFLIQDASIGSSITLDVTTANDPALTGQLSTFTLKNSYAQGFVDVESNRAVDVTIKDASLGSFIDLDIAARPEIDLGSVVHLERFYANGNVDITTTNLISTEPDRAPAGFDFVTLRDFSNNHTVTISTGLRQDTLNIEHAYVKNLNILPGFDNDIVTVKNFSSQNLNINTPRGANMVTLEHGYAAKLNVSLGRDHDTLNLRNVSSNDVTINTKEGPDVVTIENGYAGKLDVQLGAGDDVLNILNFSSQLVFLDGGTGNNTLNRANFWFGNHDDGIMHFPGFPSI